MGYFLNAILHRWKAQTNTFNYQTNLKPTCKVCNGPALGIYFKGELKLT